MKQSSWLVAAFAAGLGLAGCGTDDPGGSGGGGQAQAAGSGGSASGAAGSVGMAGTGGASGSSGAAGSAGAAGTAGAGGGAGGCAVAKTDAEVPMLLSATGCIDMTDPAKPAAGLVPYSVRSALWSDGASKERFLRIPDGQKIHALDCAVDVDACKPPGEGGSGADEGHWDMPIGSVLVKSFSIEGKRIETRLLMRRTNLVWKGFSYEWNDAGTEASLLPDNAEGKDKPVGSGDQTWHYPSRSQCLDCHTRYAGSSLGPTTAQLNSDYQYADGTSNQIEHFKALGLFDTPPKDIAGYPDPAGADGLDERARSYMQTNCSLCHRPGSGAGVGNLDLRFTTPFAQTALCEMVERDADKVPPLRLVPGDHMASTLWFRMHDTGELRMPKIGSQVEDVPATQLIADWIDSLAANACPPQQ